MEKSIIKEGCRQALVIWNGTIIDGHNRYEICQKHGIDFKTEEIDFDSEIDAKIWIAINQLARRNLNAYQRIQLVLALEELYRLKGKQKMSDGGKGGKEKGYQNSGNLVEDDKYSDELVKNQKPNKPIKDDKSEPYDRYKELAKKAQSSRDTVARVKKIEKVAPPVIKEKARSGEISINQAYKEVQKQERKKVIEQERKIRNLIVKNM